MEIEGSGSNIVLFCLNVLAAAAFQDSYDFKGSAQLNDKKRNESYRNSLYIVHEYAIYLMLIPYRFLTGPLVPRYLADIGRVALSLEARMTKMVGDEKAAIDQGKVGSNSLLTHLVRAADPEVDGSKARPGDQPNSNNSSSGRYWLSADEVLGNIFVINFAGLDTTAITFSFSVMLLAAHPDVQDWLHEERTRVRGGRAASEWEYGLFARLKRCRAVLLETLRLYGPITGLPKMTSETAQVLHVGGRVLSLPPKTETYLDLLSVHTDPRYWDDPLAWRPSRWISATQDLEEELLVPQKGSFNPWAGGVQGCVGKEFSQVEGVALLACLFNAHIVRPKTEGGETAEQARDRARACVNDFNYQLLLKMNNADRVKLECQPRI